MRSNPYMHIKLLKNGADRYMKEIKKIIFCMTILSALVLLSGCNIFKAVVEQARNNIKNEIAHLQETKPTFPSRLETAQEIINYFNSEDTSLLKELLCERSQSLNDIEEQIQDAFYFIDGNIISFNEDVNGMESESIEHGTKTKEMRESIIRVITDNENSYTIYVTENLIYSKDPKREGITEIIIKNTDDESETVIGYSWQDLYTEGKRIAYESSKVLGEGNDSAFCKLLSDTLAESTETQKNISKAMDFFDGMPYFGKVSGDGLRYDGKHDIHVTVDEEETVENGEPVCIHLTIHCENIETDAGRTFTSEIEAYIRNDEQPELIGITKFILFDEEKNSIIIE